MVALSKRQINRNIALWTMFLPIVIYFVIFHYIPMGGLIVAFKQYFMQDGIWGSPWVGFRNFEIIFGSPAIAGIIWNTLKIGFLRIVITFPFPIFLALLMNEIRVKWLKKGIQTILYLPHFFSWVAVAGIALTIFSMQTGVVNTILAAFGAEPYPFMYRSGSWLAVLIGSEIWKETGYSSIIYLAALTAVDPEQYEAAAVDGANKWKQLIHVTFPAISTTISIMLILSFGRVMSVGFEMIYSFTNEAVARDANVISTYVYQFGIRGGQFGVTTAMGLFESVVGFILIVLCNRVAKFFDRSLW
jgi:putative aldouronate transport system permease protein